VPTKPIKKFVAWSFSRLNNYRKCPFRAKLVYLDKVAEPEGPALVGGHEAHTQAEEFVTKKLKTLPDRLKLFKKEFTHLLKQEVKTEAQWAFDSQWRPVEWFSKDCWVRVVVDAFYIADKAPHATTKKAVGPGSCSMLKIVDYKTGKVREESREQLSLYALAAFSKYPLIDEVEAEFWYLDQGELVKLVYFRKDVPALQKEWAAKVVPMMGDRFFAPRPGDYCRWCPHSKSRGGKCKF
jgi:hypothetical protein